MSNDEFKPPTEESIDQRVNQALDSSIESLSPDVRRRLNQARLATVEPASNKRLAIFGWASALSVALTIVVILAYDQSEQATQTTIEPFAEVLDEDPEMLEQLEFVYWMTEEQQLAES